MMLERRRRSSVSAEQARCEALHPNRFSPGGLAWGSQADVCKLARCFPRPVVPLAVSCWLKPQAVGTPSGCWDPAAETFVTLLRYFPGVL